MKKVITFISIVLLVLSSSSLHAQDFVDPIGDQIYNGDFKNFYLIWLSDDVQNYYGPDASLIVQDLRPNGEYDASGAHTGEFLVDVWATGETLSANDPTLSANAFGQYTGGYFDWNVLAPGGWSGGGFQCEPQPGSATVVDFTGISLDDNDGYRFHMDIRKSNPETAQITLFGGGDTNGKADANQSAIFVVGDPAQTSYGATTGLPNLTPNFKVNEWQVIDIPVSELAAMGWNNRSAFSGYYLQYLPGSVAGQNLAFDAIFYYKSNSGAGMKNLQVSNKLSVVVTNQTVNVLNATAPIEVYDLAGIKVKTSENPVFGVDELNKGAYIIKSGSAVAKVIIK